MTGVRLATVCAVLLAAAGEAAADRLPTDVTPLHYQLTVTPDFRTATFGGDLTIDLRIEKATDRITLNAVDLDLHGAEITQPGGRLLHPAIATNPAAQTATFTVPTRMLPGTARLHVEYGGRLRSDGRGFYLARAYGRNYALSRMEATGARRAFPSFDEPAFTASFAISAVVDTRLTAISNGKLVSDTPGPGQLTHTLRFGTTPRMSSYLVALAVGEFQCLESAVDAVPLRACTVPEKKDVGRFALDIVEQAFRAESRYFTFRYPFGKLDLVAVPGGFEGVAGSTGVIFCDETLLMHADSAPEPMLARTAVAIAGGVARQWLGDVVSIQWWDDLWIAEGLAAWAAPAALAAWRPQWRLELSIAARTSAAMSVDSLPSTRAVRTAAVGDAGLEESFDEWAGGKAAAVFRMVEVWLGADVFRDGVNAFVRAKAYEPTAGEELWRRLSSISSEPVDRVMLSAVTRPGVPVVSVDVSCEGGETVTVVEQRRFGANPQGAVPEAGAWQVPLGIRGVGAEAPMLVVASRLLADPRQTFRIPGCFPAVIVNAGAAGYFRTLHRPEAAARLASLARERMTPAERIRLLDDWWALAGVGAQGIGDYLTLVGALAADPTPEVMEAIAAGLTFMSDYLVPDRLRPPFEAWVASTFKQVASSLGWRAAPGEPGDRQRLRAAVLDILGSAGRDRTVLAWARALAVAHLSGGQPLDRSLVAVVTRLAARSGDADLLAGLPALDAREAIAHASDAAFVTRALGAALDTADQPGRVAWWLSAALENPVVNVQAWQFLKSRWSDVQPRLAPPFALASVVTAAGAFCDGAMRDEVARFFADNLSAPPRTLSLALDRIDSCRDRRLRLEGPIAEWLARR